MQAPAWRLVEKISRGERGESSSPRNGKGEGKPVCGRGKGNRVLHGSLACIGGNEVRSGLGAFVKHWVAPLWVLRMGIYRRGNVAGKGQGRGLQSIVRGKAESVASR